MRWIFIYFFISFQHFIWNPRLFTCSISIISILFSVLSQYFLRGVHDAYHLFLVWYRNTCNISANCLIRNIIIDSSDVALLFEGSSPDLICQLGPIRLHHPIVFYDLTRLLRMMTWEKFSLANWRRIILNMLLILVFIEFFWGARHRILFSIICKGNKLLVH